jgi:hypothetical protein
MVYTTSPHCYYSTLVALDASLQGIQGKVRYIISITHVLKTEKEHFFITWRYRVLSRLLQKWAKSEI